MINYIHGSVFRANADSIVNLFDTEFSSRKGTHLQFRYKYPENHEFCRAMKESNRMRVGDILVYRTHFAQNSSEPKYIFNLPIRENKYQKVHLKIVRKLLENLRDILEEKSVKSVTIPSFEEEVGLSAWSEIRPIVEDVFGSSDVQVMLIERFGV